MYRFAVVPDALTTYRHPVLALVGDRRTWRQMEAVVTVILVSGSLVCAFSPVLATRRDGETRIRRMLTGETTHRRALGSDLQKLHAQHMGIGQAGQRGLLYLRRFCSRAPAEIWTAIAMVGAAVTAIVDRGFDDHAEWEAIWAEGKYLISRLREKTRSAFVHVGGDPRRPGLARGLSRRPGRRWSAHSDHHPRGRHPPPPDQRARSGDPALHEVVDLYAQCWSIEQTFRLV